MKTRSGGLTLLSALAALPLVTSSALADPSATSSSQSATSVTSAMPSSSATDVVSTAAPSSPVAASAVAPKQSTPGGQQTSASATSAQSTSASSAARVHSLLATSSSSSSTPVASPSASSTTTTAGISVGPHISAAVDTGDLGEPTGGEVRWNSAGGGWAQPFQNGWALVSDDGQAGVVVGSLLSYFNSHGYVNATGWPSGSAVTDAYGTYQKFDSKGHSIWGALATTPSGGVVRVGMGMYNTYFGGNLRSTLGAPLGEEIASWKAGGGGHAQNFKNGWVTYQSTRVTGWFPHNFTFAQLDFANKGWPTSGTYSACGAQKVNQLHGYTATDDRWCPASNYAQPVQGAIVSGVGATMTAGMNGIKVYWAQQKLGIPWSSTNSKLAGTTTDAVNKFQAAHHLPVTGNIDPATWQALQTGQSWNIDAWKQPSTVSTSATQAQRVNAMLAWAENRIGRRYIWGSTGPDGFDCSGFLLQAMRAGGVDPSGISNYWDYYPTSDLSWKMFTDSEFAPVSASSLQPGDFVFYGDSKKVHHVAMFIGNGKYINAAGSSVGITSNPSQGWGTLWGARRVFS